MPGGKGALPNEGLPAEMMTSGKQCLKNHTLMELLKRICGFTSPGQNCAIFATSPGEAGRVLLVHDI